MSAPVFCAVLVLDRGVCIVRVGKWLPTDRNIGNRLGSGTCLYLGRDDVNASFAPRCSRRRPRSRLGWRPNAAVAKAGVETT